MKCCVPSCNSSKNTEKVTFHKIKNLSHVLCNPFLTDFQRRRRFSIQRVSFLKFPKEKFCRAAWFAALGIEGSDANDVLMACSLHFKDCNFYNGKNGSRVLQRGAVPFVQVCVICLDTNCKLYPLSKYNLEQAYESLTGLQLQQAVPCLTPAVCSECAQRLTNSSQFRHKSLRSHILLLELYKQHELLTVPSIKTIDRLEHGLISKITQKLLKPNHCDLSIIDDSSVEIELEDAEKKSIVKLEKQAEVLIAYEPKDKYLNESQGNDFTELGLHDIKTDFECDIDIDVDHLNDENDGDFLNNDNDDGIPEDKKVEFATKIENDNESPLIIENVVEKTRNVKTANKTVRKKPPARKRNVTKKDVGPKPKRKRIRPPKVIPGIIKTIRKSRERLTIFETTKLSFEEQVEEIHKRKETSNYKNSSFRCDFCFRGFISEITYTRHMEKHSNVNGSLVCPVCKQCVKEKHALHKHSKAHETRYSCTLCEFQTMISESARMHEQWHKGTKFKCQHCDAEFLKSTSYMTHLRVKHPSDHICNQCGYSYLSDMGLRAHLRRIHRSDKVESPAGPQCAECDVRFVTAEAYERHLRVSPKHSTPETREVNQPVPRRCYSKWPQKARAPGEPLGEDAVTCEQCGLKLRDYSRYSFHFKRVHPDKNRTQYAPSKRAVLCELCGKSFQSPHHLKYHMAKHTGEKNFRCDVCERRFRIKAFLDKHKETHMDKAARRLYTCAVCDKGFTCPSSLNRHVWIHRGKSFKCEYCEKAFSNASERNCHVSHVHMKVPWPKRQRGPNRARPPSVNKDDSYDE